MITPVSSSLGGWRNRVAAAHADSGDYADQLIAAADLAEMDAIRARQAANRHRAYERRRPTRYATAAYANLRADQNPRGMISSWLDRGPRALVIAAPARVGKTYAAYAIGNTAHDRRTWVVAASAADLSDAMKPNGDPTAYDHAIRCDLLILDDLGREKLSEWWLEQLQRLVDDRCGNLRRIIITTNTPANRETAFATLTNRYGNPIAERLLDGGGIVTLDGPPVREVVTSW